MFLATYHATSEKSKVRFSAYTKNSIELWESDFPI